MNSRFGWVVEGGAGGPDPRCDIELMSAPAAAVLPTLGSIIPGWVLVIPREKALSVSDLSVKKRLGLLSVATKAAAALNVFGRNTFYFEHGSTQLRSVIGCGIDQAHLHVLVTDLDISTPALSDRSVTWRQVHSHDPWAAVSNGSDYYLLIGASGCFIGYPEQARSQFFRRHIAAAAGKPEEWNYQEFGCYENIDRTIRRFAKPQPEREAA